MKKSVILFIFIFIIFIGSFFIKKSTDTNRVIFWTLQLSVFDKYINNIISKFNDNNIKWVDVPYSEGEKRALTAILTDNPPDLINLTPDFSMLLAKKNALFEIKVENLKDYNLKEALKYNEKYYGIPFYATSAITLYNKAIMPDIEKIPETYDELLQIKPPNNRYITMISLSENDTLLKILNKYDINSPKTINSEKSIKIFEQIKNAYDKGYIPIESVVQTHRDALEKYMAGEVVFLVTGANFLNMIKENAPDVYKNTVILPQLTGTSGKYDFSLMNFVIPKKSKNKETALKFALYMTNQENQLEFSKLTSVLPVNKKTLKDDFFSNTEQMDLQSQARIISAKQLENMQMPLENIKNKKDLNILSSQAIQEILINNKDIKETLNKFKEEWEKLE